MTERKPLQDVAKCPKCKRATPIYHRDWHSLECPNCKAEIANDKYVEDPSITLEQAADVLDDIKADLLFDNEDFEAVNATTFAAHHFLTAVSHIDIAVNQLRLARLTLSREQAGNL